MQSTIDEAVTSSSLRDEAFADYLAARQAALLRTAYLLCGDQHQAEDLLQTAMAKLYLAWDRVHDRGAVDAYARRILVNEHRSLWRRPWRRRELSTDQPPDAEPHHDRYDEGTAAALWEVVRALPPRSRAVVVLRYYEQLSETEIAEALGISNGTVKSQCSRALKALRERVPAHLHPSTDETEEDR